MNTTRLSLLCATISLVSACSTAPAPRPVAANDVGVLDVPAPAPDTAHSGQLAFTLASGMYDCDLGARVEVHRDTGILHRIRIGWTGKQFDLERNLSHSGLPRYEDPSSGLVWIDLPWKSVLLDGQHNRPLASECRPATGA